MALPVRLLGPALVALIASAPAPRNTLAAPGDLDATFGAFGSGGSGVAGTGSFLPAMAVAPDGKIVLAGNSGGSLIVRRFLANGGSDLSFGVNGQASLASPTFDPHANAVAVQSDGRIVVAGWYDSQPALYMVVRLTAAGDLDPTFGWVMTDISSDTDIAEAVVIQPDGRIIAAGRSLVGGDWDFSAARYLTTGALDPSFNVDGKVTVGFGGDDRCYGIALQADGKAILVGENAGTFDKDFAVLRFTASGDLDNGFNGDGKITFGFGQIGDRAQAAAVFPDGRIVVAGHDNETGVNYGEVAVLTASGSLDGGFDGDGLLSLPEPNNVNDVVAQPDGKIVVIGNIEYTGGQHDVTIDRLNANGSQDATFSGDGHVVFDLGADDAGGRIALLPDGRLLAHCRSGSDGRLLRLLANSSLDTGGIATAAFDDATFPPGSDERGNAALVQSDGRIIVVGDVIRADVTESDFALARFLADGNLDTSFGVHGRVALSFQNFDFANATALQPDGKIVVAGYTGSGNVNFMVARFNGDGSLDTGFGFGGFNVVDFLGGADYARAVAVAPDGKIVLAGTVFNGARNVFGVARLNADGTPDLSFDVDGKQLLEFAVGLPHDATAVVVQPDRKIVVAGTVNANFGLVRFNENGGVDGTFGLSGLTQTDMGGADALNALALAPNGWFYAAGVRDVGGYEDFALAQYKPNGTLASCPPFPCSNWPSGKAYVDWGGNAAAFAVEVRSDGQIVAAGCASGGFAWAQLSPSTLVGGPIQGAAALTGFNRCAHAVRFYGTNQLVVAGTQNFNGDDNISVARFFTSTNSSVDVPPPTQPIAGPVLRANAPNPFRDRTEIRYDLSAAGTLSLRVVDVAGRLVRTLVDGTRDAGAHSMIWDGIDDGGRPSPAGVYFVRLRAQGSTIERTLILLR